MWLGSLHPPGCAHRVQRLTVLLLGQQPPGHSLLYSEALPGQSQPAVHAQGILSRGRRIHSLGRETRTTSVWSFSMPGTAWGWMR